MESNFLFYIIKIFKIKSFIKKPLWRELEYYDKGIPYYISDSLIIGFRVDTIDGIIMKPILQYNNILLQKNIKNELLIKVRNREIINELYKFKVPEDVSKLVIEYL